MSYTKFVSEFNELGYVDVSVHDSDIENAPSLLIIYRDYGSKAIPENIDVQGVYVLCENKKNEIKKVYVGETTQGGLESRIRRHMSSPPSGIEGWQIVIAIYSQYRDLNFQQAKALEYYIWESLRKIEDEVKLNITNDKSLKPVALFDNERDYVKECEKMVLGLLRTIGILSPNNDIVFSEKNVKAPSSYPDTKKKNRNLADLVKDGVLHVEQNIVIKGYGNDKVYREGNAKILDDGLIHVIETREGEDAQWQEIDGVYENLNQAAKSVVKRDTIYALKHTFTSEGEKLLDLRDGVKPKKKKKLSNRKPDAPVGDKNGTKNKRLAKLVEIGALAAGEEVQFKSGVDGRLHGTAKIANGNEGYLDNLVNEKTNKKYSGLWSLNSAALKVKVFNTYRIDGWSNSYVKNGTKQLKELRVEHLGK